MKPAIGYDGSPYPSLPVFASQTKLMGFTKRWYAIRANEENGYQLLFCYPSSPFRSKQLRPSICSVDGKFALAAAADLDENNGYLLVNMSSLVLIPIVISLCH
jgi:hypothetical protein